MTEPQMTIEERMAALQKRTKCPFADSRLFVFAQPMDPYNRRYIVLECLAKRRTVSNPTEWKVHEEDVEKLCCDLHYADVCEWYKAAKGR